MPLPYILQQASESNKKSTNKNELRKARDRRYRERHKEEINQRRRYNRLHRQSLQSIVDCLNVNSDIAINQYEAASKQANKRILRKERDRKYRERHREKINQRKKESRQNTHNMQHVGIASDMLHVEILQPNSGQIAVPNVQPSTNCINLNETKDVHNFGSQHNIPYWEDRHYPNGSQNYNMCCNFHKYYCTNDGLKSNQFGHSRSVCDRTWLLKDLKNASSQHENVTNRTTEIKSPDTSASNKVLWDFYNNMITGEELGRTENLSTTAEVPKVLNCDFCNSEIYWFRYTCVQCVSYNLCVRCEALREHADHYMLRIPSGKCNAETEAILHRVRTEIYNIRQESDKGTVGDIKNKEAEPSMIVEPFEIRREHPLSYIPGDDSTELDCVASQGLAALNLKPIARRTATKRRHKKQNTSSIYKNQMISELKEGYRTPELTDLESCAKVKKDSSYKPYENSATFPYYRDGPSLISFTDNNENISIATLSNNSDGKESSIKSETIDDNSKSFSYIARKNVDVDLRSSPLLDTAGRRPKFDPS